MAHVKCIKCNHLFDLDMISPFCPKCKTNQFQKQEQLPASEEGIKEFISKWANWWLLQNHQAELSDAFEKELRQIISQSISEAIKEKDAHIEHQAKIINRNYEATRERMNKIDDLQSKLEAKEETGEAIEFAEWIEREKYVKNIHGWSRDRREFIHTQGHQAPKSTKELYDIFKSKKQ